MYFDWKLNSLLVLPLAGLAVTSCQDYSPIADEANLAKNMAYNEAFEKSFGKIDPNQNWGFDPLPFANADEVTRGCNANSNEWAPIYNYEVPGGQETVENPIWGWAKGDVTNYERAYVYWWFSTHQWPQSIEVNWSDFFVQNVWGQPEHSQFFADGSAVTTNWGMDKMAILNPGETVINSPINISNVTEAKTHIYDLSGEPTFSDIYNFNAGGSQKEQVMYVFNQSTRDFVFHQSFDNKDLNNWTIQYINGNYYLAFDYWHYKETDDDYAKCDPDGYYNDWIIKLSTGTHKVNAKTRRVMCEDLGNTLDWDFNDVVFDVTAFEEGDNNYAMITLQAAGGTMPIWVGVDPSDDKIKENMEIHKLSGVDTTTPVNVNSPVGAERPAVVYRIPLTDEQVGWNTEGVKVCYFDKIPVYVTNNSGSAQNVVLKANMGSVPNKFACKSNTYWLKECQHIEQQHPNFWKWVGNKYELDKWQNATCTEYAYADLGTPYAISYDVSDAAWDKTGFTEWRTLWNQMTAAGGLDNTQFTAERIVYQHEDHTVGTPKITTFKEQAPYIYETAGADDDPVVYSARNMQAILAAGYVNEERVWPTEGFCTLTLQVDPAGGGTVFGAGSYRAGSHVTIKATANEGYKFAGWSNQSNFATQSYEINQDMTLIASFAKYDYLFGEFTAKEAEGETPADKLANGVDLFTKFEGLKAKGSCYIKVTFNASTAQYNSVKFDNYGSVADYTGATSTTKTVTLEWQDTQETLKITNGAENIIKLEIYTLN